MSGKNETSKIEGTRIRHVEILHDQTVMFELSNGVVASVGPDKVWPLLMSAAQLHHPEEDEAPRLPDGSTQVQT